jgi:hypothetical protein
VHASPDGHTLVHEPQWAGLLSVSTHDPEQSVRPVGQPPVLHEAAVQTSPAAHACPHDPQLPWSEARITQTPPQGW